MPERKNMLDCIEVSKKDKMERKIKSRGDMKYLTDAVTKVAPRKLVAAILISGIPFIFLATCANVSLAASYPNTINGYQACILDARAETHDTLIKDSLKTQDIKILTKGKNQLTQCLVMRKTNPEFGQNQYTTNQKEIDFLDCVIKHSELDLAGRNRVCFTR